MFKRLSIILLLAIVACTPKVHNTSSTLKDESRPKNIILMIGDGMGLSQISAGMLYADRPLNLEKIKNIGLHKTQAYNDLITDSAAGATAFSCGIKTYNGAIAVDKDTVPVKTIFEYLMPLGYKTGLVATSTIVHATPASFFAHNKSRSNYEEIAADLLTNQVDFFVGGGRKFFNRREKDDRDLYTELRQQGYEIFDFVGDDIDKIVINRYKKFGYLTADKDPLPASQGRNYLQPATTAALRYFENKEEPFMLMIEGSQIDWGGHSNQADYIISEMQDFDATIGKVLDWVEKNGETLVIITADHETGGFAINKGSTQDSIKAGFTSDYHTATMVPVFAFGPGSEDFRGIYPNSEIFNKMMKLLSIENMD